MTRREEAIEKAAAAILEATSRTRGGALIASSTAAIDIAAGTIAAYEANMRPEITSVEELDALPTGTVVLCVNERSTPDWPTLFLYAGYRHAPWLELDPGDREDGETTVPSGALVNIYGAKSIRVLHWGAE